MKLTLTYDEAGHSEQWRNDVARQLNIVLTLANHGRPHIKADLQALAERVATFEQIRKTKGTP